MYYHISDLHFGHKNIIKYEDRPFYDIDDMQEKLIENWNSVVMDDDKVFCHGDVSFMNKDKTKKSVERLNGYKILILGNHDRTHGMSWWKDVGFDEVSKYPICFKEFFWLSHEPMYINANMPYINIHGHLHSTKRYNDSHLNQSHVNVSVECINYKPIKFDEIVDRLNG